MEPCKYDKTIDVILDDIREIKTDVKALLKFKWQIFGGSLTIGFIIYLVSILLSAGKL
jgi:hypothetical protein